MLLTFLLERSSSVCVVDSPTSRGRLLPKEKTLQRSPAPDLVCLTAVGDLEDCDLDFEIQTVKYWPTAWNCEASVGGVESAPGGVDDILLLLWGVGGPSAGGVPCGIDEIDASEGDGDKTAELVLECARGWLGVLGLYYGSNLDYYQHAWK